MTRRLIATYLILAAVVLIALEVPLGVVYERGQRRDLQQRVERDAVALAALVEDGLQSGTASKDPTLKAIAERYAASTQARVVVVDRGGRLVADSDARFGLGRDFTSRPEIATALAGDIATGTRRSKTLDASLLYVAVPVASGGVVHGAVRVSVPTSRLDSLVIRYWLVLGAVAIIVLGTVAVAGRWLALWVSRPLTALRDATRRAEAGDLGVRADASSGPPEVRELSAAFNDMVSRLDLVVGTQEQFVADASHQLRSPLTALRLRIENLQHDVSPAVADDLESALGEVDRLSRLVNGLLTLAHADRSAPERERHDIGSLVEERADAWRLAAADREVEIVADVAAGLGASLSPGALEQVLDNLIANALEAAPPGSAVNLSAQRTEGAIRVDVSDHGPGMAPGARAHAFDRFWRGREDRSGSGLGLAIVKSLVEADSGSVELGEAPTGGLRVRVVLPETTTPPTR